MEPAFPQPIAVDPLGNTVHTEIPGMSLRDWFAGQALAGLMGSDRFKNYEASLGAFAVPIAYQIADAMLTERSKP